ncbi:lysophospholipid acyltransferase family protein [Streptomyces sp. NPDC058385]|uniref:lysophospholipid acyltransferase family protein n=1 Tax=Streptomyces sp. NPDC058385 TaxID=3346473 RepID=UPI00365628D7
MTSVWQPTAPCSIGACVRGGSTALASPRAVLRIAAVMALLLVGVVFLPVGRRLPAAWVRLYCRVMVRATGVRLRLSGSAPQSGGVLLVANHISWMDIPILAAVRPARMLAKKEIRQWPVAGALVAGSGAIFIDRDRLRALPGTVTQLAAVLRSGGAVGVFPEGSTWCGRAQGTYRRAAFQAALDANAPVQPVRLRYLLPDGTVSTAPAFVGDDTLAAGVWRVVSTRRIVAEVEVGALIPADSCPDRRSLARAAQPAGERVAGHP